jgi:undecaprenol kinase
MEYTVSMVHAFKKSVGHACAGLAFAWREERNFRIEVTVALFVLFGCSFLSFSFVEFCTVLAAAAAVLVAELFNTIMEEVLDIVQPSYSDHVKYLKDLTAGIVLILSLFAVVAGILTLLHHFTSVAS